MKLDEQFVITISREVGSGGRTIGRALAEKLGVRFCDKNLINSLVEKFDLSAKNIEMIKGQKKNWLADILQRSTGQEFAPAVTNDELFRAESEILKEIAAQESCVIAGRSGFFILKDCPNKLDILIRSSLSNRISRIVEKQNVSREEAERIVERVDAQRENFVRRYTDTSRYDARNYDLVLNVDGLTGDEAVDIILKYIEDSSK